MRGDNGRLVSPEDPSRSASRPPGPSAAGGRRPPGRQRHARIGAGSIADSVRRRHRRSGLGRTGSVGVGGVNVEPAVGGIGDEDLQHRRAGPRWWPGIPAGQQAGARTRCLPRRPAPWREGPAAGGAARRSTPPAPGDAADSATARCGNWPRRRLRTGGPPRDAGSRHAWRACPLVVSVARPVGPALRPWRCPIFARSCRSARLIGRRPRSRRRYRR